MSLQPHFDKFFNSLRESKHTCNTCQQQTKAFGIKVCRLGKPAPTPSKTCAFWRMK